LEKKFGYKKVHLLGHSMGGFLAMKYTLKYPEDVVKLLPVATSACIATNGLIKFGIRYVIKGYKKNYDKSFKTRKKKQAKLGLDYFPQWDRPELMPDPPAVIELFEEMLDYDIRALIPQIHCPVKVWVGTKDNLQGGSKNIARLIPNAQIEIMKGMEHNIPIHARDTLPQKIELFLKN
jgi:pimeloyl-ACP methyl ester carboxylesterase